MSEPKFREFALTWVESYKDGKHIQTQPLIIENPTADDLENNVVHVIEHSALLAANARIAELEVGLREAKNLFERLEYFTASARIDKLLEGMPDAPLDDEGRIWPSKEDQTK